MASSRLDLLKVEEDEAVPPVPTRAEEIAYLDRLEVELRNLPVANTPPDPARESRLAIKIDSEGLRRDFKWKSLMGAVLSAPAALWLARKSRALSAGGIPFRSYPGQHSVRFWGLFLGYDLAFSYAFAMFTMDRKPLEKYEYYLYETRKRHL